MYFPGERSFAGADVWKKNYSLPDLSLSEPFLPQDNKETEDSLSSNNPVLQQRSSFY